MCVSVLILEREKRVCLDAVLGGYKMRKCGSLQTTEREEPSVKGETFFLFAWCFLFIYFIFGVSLVSDFYGELRHRNKILGIILKLYWVWVGTSFRLEFL